jgi:hypothetical protein
MILGWVDPKPGITCGNVKHKVGSPFPNEDDERWVELFWFVWHNSSEDVEGSTCFDDNWKKNFEFKLG